MGFDRASALLDLGIAGHRAAVEHHLDELGEIAILNPYESSLGPVSQTAKKPNNAFLIGARNGFLWSLILAVPAAYTFYNTTCIALSNPIHLETLVRTSMPLTNEHRMDACVEALVEVTRYICLPWALIAGVVKHFRNRQSKNL